MEQDKAIEIYKLVLREINGWDEDRIDNLSLSEIIYDPFFEQIKII